MTIASNRRQGGGRGRAAAGKGGIGRRRTCPGGWMASRPPGRPSF